MRYWRLNTDSENDRTCDIWYKHHMAFAGDMRGNENQHSAVMKKLSSGDGIFMHHSGLGLIGFGIVKEDWDGKTYSGRDNLLYTGSLRKEYYEYRIPVEWDETCDCRLTPLPIHGLLPYRAAYCEITHANGWDVSAILRELRNRSSSIL